jgi:hypothetical protein
MLTDEDVCPVPDELIGRLYRSSQQDINELVSGLSNSSRGSLAAFCYGRAHLRDIGLAIAATCDLETLVVAGGRVGNFLFDQSRELPNVEKPRSGSKQAKVTLAPVNFSAGDSAASFPPASESDENAPNFSPDESAPAFTPAETANAVAVNAATLS